MHGAFESFAIFPERFVVDRFGFDSIGLGDPKAEGLWVRGYLSVVWGCPYEGPIDPAALLEPYQDLSKSEWDEAAAQLASQEATD